MTQIIQSRIYFRSVWEPEKSDENANNGKIYFQPNNDGTALEPCTIISGHFTDPQFGRISNFWTWENLINESINTGYGGFMELVEMDEADNNIRQNKIFLKKVLDPMVGSDKIYFRSDKGTPTIDPCVIKNCYPTEEQGIPLREYVLENLRTGKMERGKVSFWELCEIE